MTRRVAAVTGASRGIGRAIAEVLARDGATVVVGFRENEVQAKAVVDAIERQDGNARATQVDVSQESDVRSFFQGVKAEFGRLDVLVNNAGTMDNGYLAMMSMAKWNRVLNTNLTGTFLCCREGVKLLARSGGGAIINVASVVALGPANSGQANYAASKAAVVSLTHGLAVEAARHNIRVNAVAPGFIDTDLAGDAARQAGAKTVDGDVNELYKAVVPLGRVGRPGDVAELVAFLASTRAEYITGAVMVVDGGLSSSLLGA
jgi:3-oxoacyl-[acyl-carrier protein] reductase